MGGRAGAVLLAAGLAGQKPWSPRRSLAVTHVVAAETAPPEPGAPVDFQLLTQQVIQCAYDIAKAAKQLVTITTREKKQ